MKLKDLIKDHHGVGDTIYSITKATGIEKIVKETTKSVGIDDCGCSKRQDKLNKLFPYKK